MLYSWKSTRARLGASLIKRDISQSFPLYFANFQFDLRMRHPPRARLSCRTWPLDRCAQCGKESVFFLERWKSCVRKRGGCCFSGIAVRDSAADIECGCYVWWPRCDRRFRSGIRFIYGLGKSNNRAGFVVKRIAQQDAARDVCKNMEMINSLCSATTGDIAHHYTHTHLKYIIETSHMQCLFTVGVQARIYYVCVCVCLIAHFALPCRHCRFLGAHAHNGRTHKSHRKNRKSRRRVQTFFSTYACVP